MLAGPAPAAEKALRLANMTAADIDLFELNEAFAAVVLRFYGGFSQAEIAAHLECPQGSVGPWIRRALDRMKEQLDD